MNKNSFNFTFVSLLCMIQRKQTLIFLIWLAVSLNHVNAGGTYTMNVGETKTLSFSTSRVINSASWYSASSSIVRLVSHSVTFAKIEAIKSFSNYVIVRCDYNYWVTSGTFRYLANGFEDFKILVNPVNPTKISIPDNMTINYGYNSTITPTLTPSNAETTFTWSSSNTFIATVNSSGTVAAINPGTAYITVKTANGLTSTCQVLVPEPSLTFKGIVPANNALDVLESTNISASYSLPVFQGSKFADISLYNMDTNLQTTGNVSINSTKVTFAPAQLLSPNTNYKFTIPSNAIKNQWGTEYSTALEVNFKTATSATTNTDNIHTTQLLLYTQNRTLYIENLSVGNAITIYNTMGLIIYNGIAFDDEMVIPLSGKGMYIVQHMNNKMKVLLAN